MLRKQDEGKASLVSFNMAEMLCNEDCTDMVGNPSLFESMETSSAVFNIDTQGMSIDGSP